MSRLSAARMNAPGDKAYTGVKFLGFREKQPRYNTPIPLHGACRSALNVAIRREDKDAADHIALTHIGKPLPWWYVTLCSFTTYALSHNIGASVFSGAMVRYRAYTASTPAPPK